MAPFLPLLLLSCATVVSAGCPFGYGGGGAGSVPRDVDVGMRRALLAEKEGAPIADFQAVSVDLVVSGWHLVMMRVYLSVWRSQTAAAPVYKT
jgi:hypothetical protein